MVGHNINITCEISGDIGPSAESFEWREYVSDDSTGGTRIYADPPGDIANNPDPAKYAIYGTYNLNIKSLATTSGGVYVCRLNTADDNADLHIFVFSKLTNLYLV